MTLDEASRLHLYEQARNALGDAAANTLMTSLPASPNRLATKDDVEVLGSRLDARIDELATRFDSRFEVMNGRFEMMDGKFEILEANLRRDMAAANGELSRHLGERNSDLLRTLFFAMVGTNATLVGLVFAAVRLA